MRSAALVVIAALGCGDESRPQDLAVPDLARPPFCTADQIADGGLPPTWSNVEQIIDQNCAFGACHFPGLSVPGGPALDLTHGHAYLDLVNQTAQDLPNQCGGVIVKPGHPEMSYLMVKLTIGFGQQCNPKGHLMPIGDPIDIPLDACMIDLIRRWIEAGAPP